MNFFLPLLFALIAGIAMAFQGTLNSILAKIVGLLEATFIVHIIGVVVVCIALFGLRLGEGNLSKMSQAPWYSYLGGIISVLIIYFVVASIPKVGVANATTAIIVGQLTTAMIIDCIGLFGMEKLSFTWIKAAGMILLVAGARLMLIR
ncbi:MAG: DMT family transporter [Desulfitobacteriaceae bacterium]|nr:DMT family transporter [Desulfitobacteriaceae bacterium]MDD4752065.1 DMT family transporter [Desulfitobacteriaceae bacterium]